MAAFSRASRPSDARKDTPTPSRGEAVGATDNTVRAAAASRSTPLMAIAAFAAGATRGEWLAPLLARAQISLSWSSLAPAPHPRSETARTRGAAERMGRRIGLRPTRGAYQASNEVSPPVVSASNGGGFRHGNVRRVAPDRAASLGGGRGRSARGPGKRRRRTATVHCGSCARRPRRRTHRVSGPRPNVFCIDSECGGADRACLATIQLSRDQSQVALRYATSSIAPRSFGVSESQRSSRTRGVCTRYEPLN